MRLCQQHLLSALAGMGGRTWMSRATCQCCFRTHPQRSSTPLQTGTVDDTHIWNAACVGTYEKFLTSQLRPGQPHGPAIMSPKASEDRVLEDLASCLSVYTAQQHTIILSQLAQARLALYGQVNCATRRHEDRPVIHGYIRMLGQPVAREMQHSSISRLLGNLRLSAELMQPTTTVCWPWPARARSSTIALLSKEDETAATGLLAILETTLTAWLIKSSEKRLDWKSVTDAMLALAIAEAYMRGSTEQRIIARSISSMSDALRGHDTRSDGNAAAESSENALPTKAEDQQGTDKLSHERKGMFARRQEATETTLHVIDALEALHSCSFPVRSSLAAQLLCSAATQLNVATKSCLDDVSSASLTSAICSLILHFSANQHALVAALSSHVPRHAQGHHSRQSKAVFRSSEFRTARRLSERYLRRVLKAWSAQVLKGQVSLPDLCAVMVAFTAAQRAQPKVTPRRGPQAVVSQTYAHVCSAMISDVQRRFQDDADATTFHAWEYAAIMDCAALAPDPDAVFLAQAASLIAEDMEWAADSWRMRDLAAVLVAMTTHRVPSHRLFTAATLVCLQRLREAEGRPDDDVASCLGHVEGIVWSFSVSRRAYPYSAHAVCTVAAGVLEQLLVAVPQSVSIPIMAQLLWSFGAMWKTPPGLFQAAHTALAGRESEVDAETAMSLQWSFGRAGMPVPAVAERWELPQHTVSGATS